MNQVSFFRACAEGNKDYVRDNQHRFVPTTLRRACLTAAVNKQSDIVALFCNHIVWSTMQKDILNQVLRTDESKWALDLAESLGDAWLKNNITQLSDLADSPSHFATPSFNPVEPWSE